MGIDGNDAVHASREQRANDFLADRFALVEGSVLPHVAEIGRHQDEALGAVAPQGFGGEQQRNELVVRPIERGIDDRRGAAGPTVTRNSPSGKRWIAISCNGTPSRARAVLRRAQTTAGFE